MFGCRPCPLGGACSFKKKTVVMSSNMSNDSKVDKGSLCVGKHGS